jgi:PAS domain S-box-containing protein
LRFGIDVGAQWDAHLPFVHPDDRAETQENWSTRLRTGEGGEGSFRVRNAQGGYRWFLGRAEPLRASDGTILQWVGVNLDIEEHKCAEQALRESEYKLRQIIETVPSLLWSLAPDGEPTHFNQRFLDYFGRPFEDFKHGGWGAFVHPDDLPETEKALSHAIQTGISYQGVLRFRRADGEYRWHQGRGDPLRDRQGNIIQWYGLFVDIDEAKKAEDRLRRSEAYLAEAQRLGHSGVSTYNETTVLYGSEETYRIWGFDPAQGVPSLEGVIQRIHPDDRDRHRAATRRALDEKRGYSIAYRIVLPDGTVKHLESIGQPVFSASGELVEVVAIQIDVTERKRADEAYREAQLELAHANRVATMGQLTSSIAHEVSQPIAAAVTYALAARRWLSAEPPNFHEADDALSLIVKEGNRAGEVVGRIRALIRKAPTRKDAVAINDAVLEVIALTRTEAANHSVSVRTQLAEGLPRVQGDRVQLLQVLLNLIINAIEAMRDVGEEERELLISTRNEPDGVSVEVRDSGPGFAPAALERVFEAFYTTKPGGLGLGLSICRSIIEAHGGRLWGEANEPRGAIFQFTLPAA